MSLENGLSMDACAALRAAVDSASFDAADSVDGCMDYQLNLNRHQLEELVGAEAVRRLWQLAAKAVRRFRRGGEKDAGSSGDNNNSASSVGDDENDADYGDNNTTSSSSSSSSTMSEYELEAHEIFARRYTAATRPWFPFHKDRSEVTINVALSDDANHGGGRLIAIYDGAVRRLDRAEGSVTIHPSSLMHAVSRMTSGARYSLIIFYGRNEAHRRVQSAREQAEAVVGHGGIMKAARGSDAPG